MLMGNTAVGKTALIARMAHDRFVDDVVVTTVGIDFQSIWLRLDRTRIQLELQRQQQQGAAAAEEEEEEEEEEASLGEVLVSLEAWDTGGQERFRSMPKTYARRMDALILVYDVSDAESFEAMHGWYEEMADAVDMAAKQVLVVGAKRDKVVAAAAAAEEGAKRMVARDRVLEYADSIGARYLECSAKTGENVVRVFVEVCYDVLVRRRLVMMREQEQQGQGQGQEESEVVAVEGRGGRGRRGRDETDCCLLF